MQIINKKLIKRGLVLTAVLLFILFNFDFNNNGMKNSNSNVPRKTEPPKLSEISPTLYLDYEDKKYAVFLLKAQGNKVKLIPNYQEQLASDEIMNINSCDSLINAGFYDENHKPIGLLLTEGVSISEFKKNQTFNGFIYKMSDEQLNISYSPIGNTEFIIQTGPILIFDNLPISLVLKNDEFARRSVFMLSDNDPFFVIFTGTESLLDGPQLKDLPHLVSKLSEYMGDNIESAINLDGGSASAMITKDFQIKEYSSIGSAFCLTL